MKASLSNKELFDSIKSLILEAQQRVVRNVNTTMLVTYYHIGRMIVENEQQGQQRAGYAKSTIDNLSKQLTKEFGKGYSTTNLEYSQILFIIPPPHFPIADWEIYIFTKKDIG